MEDYSDSIASYPIQNQLTSKTRRIAKEKNNIDFMSLYAGKEARLCRGTSVSKLFMELESEMHMHTVNNSN